MKNRYSVIFSVFAVAILIGSLAGCTTYNLLTIKNSDFKNISGKIYVDSSLEESEYSKTLKNIEGAKARIEKVFGEVTVDPTIIITGTPENASKYGLKVFPGSAHVAPWETYLVLNEQKIEGINVISHELMHAQVAELTGYWVFTAKLPTWFSEGVAMQVDFRDHYMIDLDTFESSELERVMEITGNSGFWPGNKEMEIRNYRAAKVAVENLLDADRAGLLYKKLKKLSAGHEFNEIFIIGNAKDRHNNFEGEADKTAQCVNKFF
ncbi:MAG: hypothetical protein ACPGF7_13320 [Pontibacterium sp.]